MESSGGVEDETVMGNSKNVYDGSIPTQPSDIQQSGTSASDTPLLDGHGISLRDGTDLSGSEGSGSSDEKVADEHPLNSEPHDLESPVQSPSLVAQDETEEGVEEQPTEMDVEESEMSHDEETNQVMDVEQTVHDEAPIGSLQARKQDGTVVSVSLIVDDAPFDGDVGRDFSLGNDGNLNYCHVCGEFGDIVCCDGCPHVFHQTCVPTESPSRQALDNDADPWFCPDCMENNVTIPASSAGLHAARSGRSVKRKCSECQKAGGATPMVPCDAGCGNHLHHPPCREGEPENSESEGILCSNCRVEEVVTKEEQEMEEASASDEHQDSLLPRERPRHRRRTQSMDTASVDAGNSDESLGGEVSSMALARSKRKRKAPRDSGMSRSTKKSKSLKSKKKRRNSIGEESTTSLSRSPTNQSVDGIAPARLFTQSKGPVNATPAYFFYLAETRYKIERTLSRKHRYFNRMPKGHMRNELVAREGAVWWTRLRPSEHRRYMSMSMRDYEQRIIEWKEEKNIRQMISGEVDDETPLESSNGVIASGAEYEPSVEDENITYQNYKRLFVNTSVGSKPFEPEPGNSNNKILLELLQDMRFHPEPMFSATRGEAEPGQADHSKMTVPYFDVHGPISTCIGDECLGCSRGWNHFCPIIKRRLPAAENRAKLQPPLSSLLATRVGAGVRPRVSPRIEPQAIPDILFVAREKPDTIESKKVPPIPSFTLSLPSGRADDSVTFIEEAVAMKAPIPPRPAGGTRDQPKRPMLSRGKLPTRTHKVNNDPSADEELNKCGRCRTVIKSNSGCIPCRRAQLVINTSRVSQEKAGTPMEHGHSGLLKVQTTMLGRLTVKESNCDIQPEGDKAFSNALLGMRWSPSAVLRPEKIPAPSPHERPRSGDDDFDDDVTDSYPSEESSQSDDHSSSEAEDMMEGISSQTMGGHTAEIVPPPTVESVPDDQATKAFSAGRRHRSARLKAAASVTTESNMETASDRQEKARRHREDGDELNRRGLSIAISGILVALLRRDPLELFAEPVSNVEDYDKIVRNPIDFGKIRARVLRNKYHSLGSFVSDVRLLCTNALSFNDPGSIYAKTAKELLDLLEVMQKRATEWIGAIKNAHEKSRMSIAIERRSASYGSDVPMTVQHQEDTFDELRNSWPEAMDMLENGDWARIEIGSDFIRTKENEAAFFGSLAIRRAAAAVEASLASYADSGGTHNAAVRRSPEEDEALRRHVDRHVAEATGPVQLKDFSSWREEQIVRLLRRVQSRRVEGRITSESGSVRCDGLRSEQDAKVTSDTFRWGRHRRKPDSDTVPRVASSRLSLSTGLSSSRNHDIMEKQAASSQDSGLEPSHEVAVGIRGSRVHGWGLFADRPFKKGEVVAEYVGEYITNAVADAREKMYQEQRIQDYQFRVDGGLVIDATMHGGRGRYINHSCSPNCAATIIDGKPPNQRLKRVMIIAQRDIQPRDELTYDYQFPLELDLDQRIPCNCGSAQCRGFMNWDLPEKGSKNRAERKQKRGGNMRDRIRRLGRPLKKERDVPDPN